MIFDSLVLHNFGAYAGRHTVNLAPPSEAQPIVLFGGLNGGGKTTLLDAIQLSLYGKLARCSNRGSTAYTDFLSSCINRRVDKSEGAALELQFRHKSAGNEHILRVCRSWADSGKGIRERVEVEHDGRVSREFTERWQEIVEEFLPVRISHLFLFDGEQIEAFADPATSAEVLSVAIRSLLGLDLVDQLTTDLIALERRKSSGAKPTSDEYDADTFAEKVETLTSQVQELYRELAAARTKRDRLKKRLRDQEGRFRSQGGELFEQREALRGQRTEAAAEVDRFENALRDLAYGAAPLFLVPALLKAVGEQSLQEQEARDGEAVDRILGKRDAWLIGRLEALGVSKKHCVAVRKALKEERAQRRSESGSGAYLVLDTRTRDLINVLNHSELVATYSKAREFLMNVDQQQEKMDQLDRLLAAVPDEDEVAKLVADVDALREEVELADALVDRLGAEWDRLKREIDHYRTRLEAALRRAAHEEFLRRDAKRVLVQSARARETLSAFRSSVVERHVRQLETYILESYQKLLWKKSLVSAISIDPQTYHVTLKGSDGKVRTQHRISAGERQLLALAILWGLARASGRRIPVVIDTPLGRLDSSHKLNMVTRYFPAASHQVLLLSTDEEVDESYYAQLEPHVGRAYRLVHDEGIGATHVEDGYFWRGES